MRPVFLLVLDTALIEEELDQAKDVLPQQHDSCCTTTRQDSLQQSLAMMPQNALVGFITFGAMPGCQVVVICVFGAGSADGPKRHTTSPACEVLRPRVGVHYLAKGLFCAFDVTQLSIMALDFRGLRISGWKGVHCAAGG